MIRIPVRILFILWSKKSPPRSLPCFSRIWAEFCINKWILTGYDYAINSSNNLTTKMAVHSTLTSKRTLCRHLLWGETQESSPQSREGKGYLREQVYFKRPSVHTVWIWIWMTKRPAKTSYCFWLYNNENGMKTVKATSVWKQCVHFVVIFEQFVPIS